MRSSMQLVSGLLALALFAAGSEAPRAGEAADAAIAMRSVKYADLCKIIRGHKGKVVIVDFWAEY